MDKYIKLELEDLPKSAVVNSSFHVQDTDVDQLINEIVTDHITKIVDIEEPQESATVVQDKVVEVANVISLDEVKKLKQEAYDRATEEAQKKHEATLAEYKAQSNFSELLQQKISSIVPEEKIDSQIAKISAETISAIAQKLYLILPVNFEEIIKKGLVDKLQSFYKEGNIDLIIHPDRYDLCKEILQSDSIPVKFKDNFKLIKDDRLGKDDCSIKWSDTRLEYNQEQLSIEINKILEQLQSAV